MNRLLNFASIALALLIATPVDGSESFPVPAKGKIRVAIALAPGAQMIDFAGPWEVFQDVHVSGETHNEIMPFELFTVAATREAVRITGGMRVLPDYTFDDAPQPDVIVVPALRGSDELLLAWLRRASVDADITMSVCTGAFQLGAAGLLDGLRATTHHRFLNAFEESYEKVELERNVRWVDNGSIATAAGLTSGIDLALHIVARYFGDDVALQTAEYMEHDSSDWRTGERTTNVESKERAQVALQGLDPILLIEGREAEGQKEFSFHYDGFEYHFASAAHRKTFAQDPERWGIQLRGACAAMGSFGADPGLYTVHDGKIYVFGSASCRESFSAEPESYLARLGADGR